MHRQREDDAARPRAGGPGPGVRGGLEELIVRIQLTPGVISVAHGD